MEEFIKYLLSNDGKHLRNVAVFKIVPMINPDGVAVGNYSPALLISRIHISRICLYRGNLNCLYRGYFSNIFLIFVYIEDHLFHGDPYDLFVVLCPSAPQQVRELKLNILNWTARLPAVQGVDGFLTAHDFQVIKTIDL